MSRWHWILKLLPTGRYSTLFSILFFFASPIANHNNIYSIIYCTIYFLFPLLNVSNLCFYIISIFSEPLPVTSSLQETTGRGRDPHRDRHYLSQPLHKCWHRARLQLPDPHLHELRQELEEGGQGGGPAEQVWRQGVPAGSL